MKNPLKIPCLSSLGFSDLRRPFLFAFFILHSSFRVLAADWPQLGCNAGKTSWTPDEPKPPYSAAWVFDLLPGDRLLATVQAVTWQGRAFIGSKRGALYAVNLADGSEAWRFEAGRPILQAAGCIEGKVIFGAMDGCVYAVEADTGRLAWKRDLEAKGVSTAPLLDNGRIFMGTRGGLFVCLEPGDGALVWRRDIGCPIMQSAAGGGGCVFFAAEDMRMRCLDAATGGELWRAEPLRYPPPTLRGSHPVYHRGRVFMGNGRRRMDVQNQFDFLGPPALPPRTGPWTPAIAADEIDKTYLEWLDKYKSFLDGNRFAATLVTYNATDGEVLPPLPTAGTASMADPLQAPAVTADGMVIYPSVYDTWWTALGLFDPSARAPSCFLTWFRPSQDETMNYSVGGNVVFGFHMWEQGGTQVNGYVGACDMSALRQHEIPQAFPTSGGEWKAAPPGNAASITGNMFLHNAAHRLAAWKGAG